MTQPSQITQRVTWACALVICVGIGIYLAWIDPGVVGTLGVLGFGFLAGVSLLMIFRLRPGRRARTTGRSPLPPPGGHHYPDGPVTVPEKQSLPNDRGDRI